MMPFHWQYEHIGHIGLSYDLHGSSRSYRYLLQVAGNCSPLVKDTDYIGIFIVFVSSVIALLLLCQVLDTFFGTYLLRDYRTHGSQLLHYETTYPRDGPAVFRLSIQTPVLDLQANPDFHVLIHIFRTTYPIVTCDTSTCSS
jgi:hypothetical protein